MMEIKKGQVWKNKNNINNKICVIEDSRNVIRFIDEYGKPIDLSYYELVSQYLYWGEYQTLEDAYNSIKLS